MEIRVLGPVELRASGAPVALPAKMHRRLLTALAIEPDMSRSNDALIEALWGERPPASAGKLLQLYISQLRKVLSGPIRISTRGEGYALELGGSSLDARRFEQLLDEARAARAIGNPTLAASLYRRALSMWRGRAYGEFHYEEFARMDAERLQELRRVCIEGRFDTELALGRHVELLPELQRAADAEPLRERLQAELMLALYRSGRQSEALERYRMIRASLLEEHGLDPGADLRTLQRQILAHDPALALVPMQPEQSSILPMPPGPLIGRDRELSELDALLRSGDPRLIVLTGAGGSGKTRLALEAAHRAAADFANGAAVVSLAPLRDPGLVPAAIAQALGLELGRGNPLDLLANSLSGRELLLLLDNAEHLRAAAPSYVELLRRAPHLIVLVTSRVVLHLSGEHVYPVEPLELQDATSLFEKRVGEAEPRFRSDPEERQAIAQICERLDCLPLAIELAASRVRTLAPTELLARLEPSIPLLTGGPSDLPARQQTLAATLAWSYDLLREDEQRDFRRLSVFAGGCTLDAAEAVCGTTLDTLGALVDSNLLRRITDETASRYLMLETVREFAEQKLEDSDEAAQMRHRHFEHFSKLADRERWTAQAEFDSVAEVMPEVDNLRVALEWALESGHSAPALAVLNGIWSFWEARSMNREALGWYLRAFAATGPASSLERAAALAYAGRFAAHAGEYDEAVRLLEGALAMFRELGHQRAANSVLVELAYPLTELNELERARAVVEQALDDSSPHDDPLERLHALHYLGEVELKSGNTARAKELLEDALALAQQEGVVMKQGSVLHSLGDVDLAEGDLAGASERYQAGLRLALTGELAILVPACLGGLAAVAARRGQLVSAGTLWAALERSEWAQASMEASRRRTYEGILGTLDAGELAEAIAAGRLLGRGEVISLALSVG
jgi:predicted ATPase/DNA-binding SARP family transcriptional activator/predicted negative regulator of RcsB-dependent stress response